jgi:hypothetical protein
MSSFQALQSSPKAATTSETDPVVAKDMVELFTPLRGLNLDFEADRSRDTNRDTTL